MLLLLLLLLYKHAFPAGSAPRARHQTKSYHNPVPRGTRVPHVPAVAFRMAGSRAIG
jgi:hypothetical protein